ncbi:conserved hypothetical protein [Candidatus Nitrotoga sp. HW29]|uniref:hypothetical protein n=1 Tax=Candidatus Nitrotoga sp. HW29 TaxID=2886963 RepID=UPI001EF197A3|nr:hypothetical protein [Candidatus Nitrotoga sp. HW29]CAH1904733.1 conserved hypothetical protein [Candidatus Nitrotoga sp. HW29]
MDSKIIFIKTSKGEDESNRLTNYLSSEIKRAFYLIDNKSTVKELMKRAAPSLRVSLEYMLQELINGGFIQDKDKVNCVTNIAIPRDRRVNSATKAYAGRDRRSARPLRVTERQISSHKIRSI